MPRSHPDPEELAMPAEPRGSVSRWIDGLKAGDHEAADHLWGRYFERLVGLARRKLAGGGGAGEDEEDAALSAFRSLWAGASAGRFDRLGDRDDLWRLLVVITARKAADQRQRRAALKRGGGRVVDEAALGHAAPGDDAAGLDRFLGPEPTPEFAAMVAEEYLRRLDALGDETLRQVAVWKLEGYGHDEIAARLGCVVRSVGRKLDLIRRAWLDAEDAR